jgi:hypothetical protein
LLNLAKLTVATSAHANRIAASAGALSPPHRRDEAMSVWFVDMHHLM